MKSLVDKYKIPIAAFIIFSLVGVVMWLIRDVRYFYLFAGIGFAELSTRIFIIHYPKYRQFFRLTIQFLLGSMFVFWLSLFIGVNFQFPEIFFDASAGIVTGALIQMLVARIVLPFFFGNAFCSRACWTGFFFEITNSKEYISRPAAKRSELLAWGYIAVLIIVPITISIFYKPYNPAQNDELRRFWIIGENLFIVGVGFAMTFWTGSRSYCRMLCPFITISGLFSKYSFFKITPVKADDCTECDSCTKACPMLIDVKTLVINKEKVSHKLCIVCERCVSSCSLGVLKLTHKKVNSELSELEVLNQ